MAKISNFFSSGKSDGVSHVKVRLFIYSPCGQLVVYLICMGVIADLYKGHLYKGLHFARSKVKTTFQQRRLHKEIDDAEP